MAYTNLANFSNGQVLPANTLNQLLGNIEDNRDRLNSPGASMVTNYGSTSADWEHSSIHGGGDTYPSSAVVEITETFHGRPILIMILGLLGIRIGETPPTPIIGYKVDSNAIAAGITSGQKRWGGNQSREYLWTALNPTFVITGVSSGSHTIGFYPANMNRWLNPGVIAWELPFDSF